MAFPCFKFAKEMGLPPKDIAKKLCEKISVSVKKYPLVEKVAPEGPYINITLNRKEAYKKYKEYFRSSPQGCSNETGPTRPSL